MKGDRHDTILVNAPRSMTFECWSNSITFTLKRKSHHV